MCISQFDTAKVIDDPRSSVFEGKAATDLGEIAGTGGAEALTLGGYRSIKKYQDSPDFHGMPWHWGFIVISTYIHIDV